MTQNLKEEIKEILRTTPIAGDFDRTRAIYANEAAITKILSLIESDRKFYRERMNLLSSYQKEIPEPYRTVICNILANGAISATAKKRE